MAKPRILLTVFLTLCLLLLATSCQDLEGLSSSSDSDGDGWSDAQERVAGTDPRSVDTDKDGYWDPHDPNPLDANVPVNKGLPEPTPKPEQKAAPAPAPGPAPSATPAAPATESPASPAEKAAEELRKVQAAVEVMMRNNGLVRLASPVRTPTNDMHRFPDATTKHGTAGVGYVLYLHDFDGDGSADTNYIQRSKTKGTYICDEYGNVTQVTTGYE